jgi:peroxiredoxin
MIRKSIVTTLSSAAVVFAVAMFAFAAPPKGGAAAGSGGGGSNADTMSLVGKPAPDFTLPTFDKKTVQLSSEKGNVVLLDYWATWCPPCRKGLPHIQEIANDKDLAAKGLKVWAINSKEDDAKVKPFLEKQKLTMTVPMDTKGEFGKAYLVQGIPTTVVVGRDGMIKKVFIGFGDGQGEQIRAAVEAALNEPAPTKPA